jgi:hydroxymethylbilane synthase
VIRIGTRGSALALAQAEAVAAILRGHQVPVELVAMRTEGDLRLNARLAVVGGKGLFVREIEQALLRGDVDVAVHSLKDLPADLPEGLALAAFPPREDPRDVLVSGAGGTLEALPAGAVVGTSSPRRQALVLALRPDVTVAPIRGNVETRLARLADGGFDAILLAAAGLRRLGLAPAHAEILAAETFVPAVGQGILGVQARADDRRLADVLRVLDHAPTRVCALAERACLERLGASCHTAMAAHAWLDGGTLRMLGFVASDDGHRILRAGVDGGPEDAAALGARLGEALLARGAAAVAPLTGVARGQG